MGDEQPVAYFVVLRGALLRLREPTAILRANLSPSGNQCRPASEMSCSRIQGPLRAVHP